MRKYQFSGHLSPLPPGVKLPLQLSGEVYLTNEVEVEFGAMSRRFEMYISKLRAQVAKLNDQNKALKKQVRALRRLHE